MDAGFRSTMSGVERGERWIALALCASIPVLVAMEQIVRYRPVVGAGVFTSGWLPLIAAGCSAVGLLPVHSFSGWRNAQRLLLWSGVLLMLWAANGLPFDLLRLTPLIPLAVDWHGLMLKIPAFAAAIVLAHLALKRSVAEAPDKLPVWYGYAAFVVALPYPVLRTVWALGGTIGLERSGAAGHGFLAWLACVPWLMAAVLSLALIPTWRWMPRRLLLIAGWSATAIVAMVGPAACWLLATKMVQGADLGLDGIAAWIPCLFYGSWLLWGLAAAAATRSYQLRSAAAHRLRDV